MIFSLEKLVDLQELLEGIFKHRETKVVELKVSYEGFIELIIKKWV